MYVFYIKLRLQNAHYIASSRTFTCCQRFSRKLPGKVCAHTMLYNNNLRCLFTKSFEKNLLVPAVRPSINTYKIHYIIMRTSIFTGARQE